VRVLIKGTAQLPDGSLVWVSIFLVDEPDLPDSGTYYRLNGKILIGFIGIGIV